MARLGALEVHCGEPVSVHRQSVRELAAHVTQRQRPSVDSASCKASGGVPCLAAALVWQAGADWAALGKVVLRAAPEVVADHPGHGLQVIETCPDHLEGLARLHRFPPLSAPAQRGPPSLPDVQEPT
jgi:hypothetical protein